MNRIFFDITYTRRQRENVGITRTVNRLLEEMRQGPVPVQAVVFSGNSFVPAEEPPGSTAPEQVARSRGWLFKMAASGAGKALLTLMARLPWGLFRPIWEFGTARAFPGDGAADIRFSKGDLVLLADASWNYAVWKAIRRARAQGARVAVVIYDLMPLRQPHYCAPLVVRLFSGWLTEMFSCADALVCISSATEDDLQEWAKASGARLPPTGHFRLGSDPRTVATSGEVRPAMESFLTGGTPCFAAVGSIEPKKNYGFLLDTFERLWAEGVPARLLIAGRVTPEWQEQAERLRAHPEHGRQLLTIFDATDAEIFFIYSNCRALVFPSLMEGFGLPLVEARSLGCPVIASDLAVFAELADQGVFLYERHSADELMRRLREHFAFDTRRDIGRMQPFLWRHSATQLLQVITSILPRSNTTPGQPESSSRQLS